MDASRWPDTPADLIALQQELGRERAQAWQPGPEPTIAGCFVCFQRGGSGPGAAGEPGWAAAVLLRGGHVLATAVVSGAARGPYEPGLLALREGPLLEAAVCALPERPDVLLVNATGRDHPRRAGLALQLGAVLDLPSAGVTHRPLLATGAWPVEAAGAASPLLLVGELVGYWLRTRRDTRPLAVHAGWRSEPESALAVANAALGNARTPRPLRLARQLARTARAAVR